MLLISIPKPCHENWNEMSPRQQGAFCAVCSKTVVDFTSLSDEEVKNYFLQRQGQKTCGRFRNDQLAEPRTLHELLSRPIPFWKKFLAIVCIVFGSFLSSCQNTGKDKVRELNSITLGEAKSEYVTSGLTLMEIIPDTALIEETACTTIGTPAIITEDIVDSLQIEIDGVMPIEVLGKTEVKIDSSCTALIKLKEDSGKKINPVLPKVDSIKKIMPPSNCDTLPKKLIEP